MDNKKNTQPQPNAYRFAPSPTGQMHIGNLRSAIFSWLLARNSGSKFYLRIEDTDLVRSTKEASEGIFRSLNWIGLDWDNVPVYQSQRFDVYKAWAQKLIDQKKAYFCQCSIEHMDSLRQASSQEGENFRYPGTCREKGIQNSFGVLPLRFLVNREELGQELEFNDLIKGSIKTAVEFLDDIVLFRSDGVPTYNFCVVIDDYQMGVTHVVRGEDHICNTPKQILIYRAFGMPEPLFGHLPMVLDQHGAKLSKRSGTETSLDVYRQQGFVPEAILNYLVRLGWSHGDQEVFSKDELISLFSLEKIGRKSACFDIKKLQWLNGIHIKKLSVMRALELLEQMDSQLFMKVYNADPELFKAMLAIYLPKAQDLKTLLSDLEVLLFHGHRGFYDLSEFKDQGTVDLVCEFVTRALESDCFVEAELFALAKEICAAKNRPIINLAQPLRVALTGQKVSPSVFAVAQIFGKEEFKDRMKPFCK